MKVIFKHFHLYNLLFLCVIIFVGRKVMHTPHAPESDISSVVSEYEGTSWNR